MTNKTNYKVLYLSALEENKNLKAEIEEINSRRDIKEVINSLTLNEARRFMKIYNSPGHEVLPDYSPLGSAILASLSRKGLIFKNGRFSGQEKRHFWKCVELSSDLLFELQDLQVKREDEAVRLAMKNNPPNRNIVETL